MSNREKQSVRDLIAAGTQPSVTGSGNVVLKRGARGYITLVRGNRATPLGQYYQQQTGVNPAINILPDSVPTRMGRTEYIRTRGGVDRALRVYDVVRGVWKLTSLGRQYYNQARDQVVVHLPIIVRGRSKNSTTYEIRGTMPVEIEGLQEGPHLKQQVLAHYGGQEGQEILVSTQGDEEFWHNPAGHWQISTLRTEPVRTVSLGGLCEKSKAKGFGVQRA